MHYSLLADAYEELEGVPSKLKKTEILAKLLKETPTDDLETVVLLATGNVFPSWSEEEIGVAEKMMVKAIAKACGAADSDAVKMYKKTGDLGLTAEEMAKSKRQKSLLHKALTVSIVSDNIKKLSGVGGKGSQERKMSLIAELLVSAKPKEARYVVRTVLQELRIGVAEGIIRDSIAKAFDVNADAVENAYFLNQDYGLVAKIARKSGEAGLKKVGVELGKPISVLLGEKAPSLKEAIDSFDRVALEVKYDGMRVQIHKNGKRIWLYTRRQENVTKQFPDIVRFAEKFLKPNACIVEGEALAVDPKSGKPVAFQMLSQRIKRKYDIEKTVKDIPVEVNLFDIVYLNGRELFDVPFHERRKLLEESMKTSRGEFQLAEQIVTKDIAKAERFYNDSLKSGQEGVMVKNLDSKYVFGRKVAGGWLKVKPVLESLDLAIIGATWGTGKRVGGMGSFVLGVLNDETGKFEECGMLGTGIKEKSGEGVTTLTELTKLLRPHIESEKGNHVTIHPKVIIEVQYEEIQQSPTYSSGYALRFPRMIHVRYDKSARDADTLSRLKEIYKMQKGRRK